MALRNVLIVNNTYPAVGIEMLKKHNLNVTVLPYPEYDSKSLLAIKQNVHGYSAIIWNTKYKLNAEILDLAGPQLKAVSTMSSGVDHIDIIEVKSRGIYLGNTPQALDNAVADIAVGLLIAAARRFKEGIEIVESGDWKFGVQWMLGQDIANKTVGIVGLGGIGQAIVRRLAGFDVGKFIYSGRTDKPEAKALNIVRVPLEQLLKESDYVILCCPLTEETKHLINADTLNIMKSNAVLINIARGGVVNTNALYEALKEKRIFAVGLDVVDPEPISKDHPIVSLPNCYLVPHLGSATIETRNNMASIAAANIIEALRGKAMPFPVV